MHHANKSLKTNISIQILCNNSVSCGCTSLQKIEIPNSVISIDDRAFLGCSSLKEITINNQEIEKVKFGCCFNDIDFNNCILYIPSGTRWAYRHHPIFGKFKNIATEKSD